MSQAMPAFIMAALVAKAYMKSGLRFRGSSTQVSEGGCVLLDETAR
jgi:hypothetical protein